MSNTRNRLHPRSESVRFGMGDLLLWCLEETSRRAGQEAQADN